MIDAILEFDEYLLTSNTIERLQWLLFENMKEWSKELHVHIDDDEKFFSDINNKCSLKKAIERTAFNQAYFKNFFKKATPWLKNNRYGHGMAELRGSDPSLTVLVDVTERLISRSGDTVRWGNSIVLQFRKAEEGASEDEVEFSREIFEKGAKCLNPIYGYTASLEEYYNKNMDLSGGGMRAIGVNFAESLPGIYWINAFGGQYLEFFGKDRLLSAPAHEVKDFGNAVVVYISGNGTNWNSEQYKKTEMAVRNHLGDDCFFDRSFPERPGRTLDLSQYAKSSGIELP